MVLAGFVGSFGWFWVVLVGFGWFWLVPCFSNYAAIVHYSIVIFFPGDWLQTIYTEIMRSWNSHYTAKLFLTMVLKL